MRSDTHKMLELSHGVKPCLKWMKYAGKNDGVVWLESEIGLASCIFRKADNRFSKQAFSRVDNKNKQAHTLQGAT